MSARKTVVKTVGKVPVAKGAAKKATAKRGAASRKAGPAVTDNGEWTPPTSAQEQARKPKSGKDSIPDAATRPGTKEANSIP